MTTKRETLLATVAASLDAAKPGGTAVFRNRREAYAAGQSIAIVVRQSSDLPEPAGIANGPINSRLSFVVEILSVADESTIDDVAEYVYAVVMAGVSGSMDITPGPNNWDMDGASDDVTVLSMEFEILYRHSWGSLSA